jgi:hypothetical protein
VNTCVLRKKFFIRNLCKVNRKLIESQLHCSVRVKGIASCNIGPSACRTAVSIVWVQYLRPCRESSAVLQATSFNLVLFNSNFYRSSILDSIYSSHYFGHNCRILSL